MTARSFTPNTFATLACVAVGALVLVGKAAAVVDAGTKPRFGAVPARVAQGNAATVTAAAPAGARCTLTVRYGDGALQPGLAPARATAGRARWKWRVPEEAATGPAKLILACGAARATASFAVTAGPKQTTVAVTDRGFSQRTRYGRTTVSYGVVLTNTSPDRDALQVTVIVNFIDATNTVLGTHTSRIDGIEAGEPFYLGGGQNVPVTPIERLEVVVTVGSRAPRVVHEPPLADVRVTETSDGYVAAVIGQFSNDVAGTLLRSASMSAVFFDAAGNVTGGATGNAHTPLPHDARAFFKASTYASSVPMTKAATVRVSVEPRFQATG
jgi:hypothetical protein